MLSVQTESWIEAMMSRTICVIRIFIVTMKKKNGFVMNR